MPASDSDIFEEETQELLALVKVECVQRGERSLGEVGDPLLESVLLARLRVLVCQRIALPAEVVATGLELSATGQEPCWGDRAWSSR